MIPSSATYALSLADYWNERIEDLIYTTDGRFCATHGVDGYYVRIAPRFEQGGLKGRVPTRNTEGEEMLATDLIGMEFLCLVRCGLRRADDPHVLNTLKVVDAELRRDTPSGPSYHRYNGDAYGEKADGTPYDGEDGIGRLWPLLTGERGHYAVAANQDAHPYLEAMARMTGPGGLIPEQVWDSEAIPAYNLFPGKPSGSAMPLIWAHAEYLKLLAAQADGSSSDALPVVEERYKGVRPTAANWHWCDDMPFDRMPSGRGLSIERPQPFEVTCSLGQPGEQKRSSTPTAFGLHAVRFSPEDLKGAASIALTLSDRADRPVTIAIDAA